jgi:pyrimidine operon attenuation protein/uracil phosphoribosyltransferase
MERRAMIDAELAAAMGAAEQAAIDVEQAEISVFRDDALQRKKTADAESWASLAAICRSASLR